MAQCPFCKATDYQKRNGFVARCQRFKCRYCSRYYTEGVLPRARPPEDAPILHKCLNCGRESPNPKFCSRACHLAFGTLKPKGPKKKQPRFCKYCGVPVTNRYRVCKDCNTNNVDWGQRTLGDVRALAKYQWNGQIRRLARWVFRRAGLVLICANCGYDKHAEICHIRGISSFSDNTPVSVINDLNNLVALCPNCHWEFDHGLLSVEDILRPREEG